jgi:hypothetical protein
MPVLSLNAFVLCCINFKGITGIYVFLIFFLSNDMQSYITNHTTLMDFSVVHSVNVYKTNREVLAFLLNTIFQ